MPKTISDQAHEEIIECLTRGKKIAAIKIYREETGEGLKESKDFIDSLTSRLREEHPERFPASTSGCGAVVLLALTIVGGGAVWCLV